jgi:hypothetical protein
MKQQGIKVDRKKMLIEQRRNTKLSISSLPTNLKLDSPLINKNNYKIKRLSSKTYFIYI